MMGGLVRLVLCSNERKLISLFSQLSAHQLATSKSSGVFLPWYKGELLLLAHDLGRRLLPAFDTKTGIPYARINLSKGVRPRESTETCTAGAASLILECQSSRTDSQDEY